MTSIRILFLFLISQLLTMAEDEDVLPKLLKQIPERLQAVARAKVHEVQILYVQIERTANGPVFTEHGWQLDDTVYFYPASTVKLPVALLALEKLEELDVSGLNKDTSMLTLKARDWQTERLEDASSKTGLPSVAHDVRKIFLVSDNDSYNRLFEFVGAAQVRDRCVALGCESTHIFHRLAVGRNPDHGRFGNPVRFVNGGGETIHLKEESTTERVFGHGMKVEKGKGYWTKGQLVEEPMSFSDLNFFPLRDQHRFLREVFFPAKKDGLGLSEEDRAFVQKVMGQYPRENQEFANDSVTSKPDLYVKNFLRWKSAPVRDSLRCYNKSGRAYGYLTDNAYIVDREHGVEFFLAATIHVNRNQTYNDNIYQYEEIGEPFFAALGEIIYGFERSRKKSGQ